jgi:hypothetical protein
MARPVARRPRTSPFAATQSESASSVDPADVVIGVLLLVAIPLAVYLLLFILDMPVSGTRGASWGQTMKMHDDVKAIQPPLQPQEFEQKLARVDSLLASMIPDYVRRSRAEDDPRIKVHWQKCAKAVLGKCESELDMLLDAIPESSALRDSQAFVQQIESRLNDIAQRRSDLNKENPF